MTSVGLGRDLKSLRDIALRTGLNVVAGCGWYRDPFLPQEVFETTSDGLADILISEINEGAEDGGVRPGIIGEIGAKRNPMSPAEERVLRAGGFAQLQTGVSIYTHASRSTVGIEQAQILISIGVPPERIVIGHADTIPENRKDYWSELLDMGVTLGFDTVKPDFPYELGGSYRWSDVAGRARIDQSGCSLQRRLLSITPSRLRRRWLPVLRHRLFRFLCDRSGSATRSSKRSSMTRRFDFSSGTSGSRP